MRSQNLVVGEDGQNLRVRVAREALGLDRGDRRRHAEDLGGLGERDDVVLQRLPVDRLHAERHLRLLVDDDQLAVLRGEQFEIVGHDGLRLLVIVAMEGGAERLRLRLPSSIAGQAPMSNKSTSASSAPFKVQRSRS